MIELSTGNRRHFGHRNPTEPNGTPTLVAQHFKGKLLILDLHISPNRSPNGNPRKSRRKARGTQRKPTAFLRLHVRSPCPAVPLRSQATALDRPIRRSPRCSTGSCRPTPAARISPGGAGGRNRDEASAEAKRSALLEIIGSLGSVVQWLPFFFFQLFLRGCPTKMPPLFSRVTEHLSRFTHETHSSKPGFAVDSRP